MQAHPSPGSLQAAGILIELLLFSFVTTQKPWSDATAISQGSAGSLAVPPVCGQRCGACSVRMPSLYCTSSEYCISSGIAIWSLRDVIHGLTKASWLTSLMTCLTVLTAPALTSLAISLYMWPLSGLLLMLIKTSESIRKGSALFDKREASVSGDILIHTIKMFAPNSKIFLGIRSSNCSSRICFKDRGRERAAQFG